MTRPWHRHGKSMAETRQEHGNSMARTWQRHGIDKDIACICTVTTLVNIYFLFLLFSFFATAHSLNCRCSQARRFPPSSLQTLKFGSQPKSSAYLRRSRQTPPRAEQKNFASLVAFYFFRTWQAVASGAFVRGFRR